MKPNKLSEVWKKGLLCVFTYRLDIFQIFKLYWPLAWKWVWLFSSDIVRHGPNLARPADYGGVLVCCWHQDENNFINFVFKNVPISFQERWKWTERHQTWLLYLRDGTYSCSRQSKLRVWWKIKSCDAHKCIHCCSYATAILITFCFKIKMRNYSDSFDSGNDIWKVSLTWETSTPWTHQRYKSTLNSSYVFIPILSVCTASCTS